MSEAKEIKEMLEQSNWIEREYSDRALKDAVKAWDWIYAHRNEDLKLKHVLRIHELLARNIRPDIAGKLRNCDVWIGGQCKRFISDYLLRREVDEFCKDYWRICSLKKQKTLEELQEMVKQNHIKFENIHVFVDFNGRSGRLLMNMLRIKCGLSILVIHGWALGDEDFHFEQDCYYSWFRNN